MANSTSVSRRPAQDDIPGLPSCTSARARSYRSSVRITRLRYSFGAISTIGRSRRRRRLRPHGRASRRLHRARVSASGDHVSQFSQRPPHRAGRTRTTPRQAADCWRQKHIPRWSNLPSSASLSLSRLGRPKGVGNVSLKTPETFPGTERQSGQCSRSSPSDSRQSLPPVNVAMSIVAAKPVRNSRYFVQVFFGSGSFSAL